MMNFVDLQVRDMFMIPSGFNHEMECFIKLPFNKARAIEGGRICHFGDFFTVWTFE